MAQIVGDGILSFYIQYLVAIPDYRKQGVRKKLVLKAIDKIKKTYNPDEVKIIFDLYISRLLFNILEEDYLSSYFFRISAIIKAKKSS